MKLAEAVSEPWTMTLPLVEFQRLSPSGRNGDWGEAAVWACVVSDMPKIAKSPAAQRTRIFMGEPPWENGKSTTQSEVNLGAPIPNGIDRWMKTELAAGRQGSRGRSLSSTGAVRGIRAIPAIQQIGQTAEESNSEAKESQNV